MARSVECFLEKNCQISLKKWPSFNESHCRGFFCFFFFLVSTHYFFLRQNQKQISMRNFQFSFSYSEVHKKYSWFPMHLTVWSQEQTDVPTREESTDLAQSGTGQWPAKWGGGLSVSCSSSWSKHWPLKHDQEWELGNYLQLKDNQKGGKWRESANEKRDWSNWEKRALFGQQFGRKISEIWVHKCLWLLKTWFKHFGAF